MYIVNGKSITGPNPGHLAGSTATSLLRARAARQSVPQRPLRPGPRTSTSSSSSAPRWFSAPVPASEDLERLTMRVAANNFYSADHEDDQHT